jgi:hypothetical protein
MREIMSTSKTIIMKRVQGLLGSACFVTLTFALLTSPSAGQQPGQKTFASPGEAAEAMIAAAKAGSTDALLQIFGPEGKELISSGDDVADKNGRNNIVQKYEQMHRLVREPDDTVSVYMGAENWPFPIPLVKKGKAWYFDTPAGKQEVLYRRIGKNELATIDVLHAIVDAQKQYQSETHDGDTVKQYAVKIVSDPGQHNGLYWKVAAGEPQSPIGPLIADAVSAGYTRKQKRFHALPRIHLQAPEQPGTGRTRGSQGVPGER